MYWEKCLQHPLFFAIHIVIVLKVEIFLLSLDDILARNCCGGEACAVTGAGEECGQPGPAQGVPQKV